MKFKLHHIAYATKSTDKSIESFKNIYCNIITYKKLEKSQNVYYTYLGSEVDQQMIELVEPYGESTPIDNILKNSDCVLYHICYEVDDLKEAKEYLTKRGFFMVTKPFEPEYEKGTLVCHFFNPYSGVTEILCKGGSC
ncbi:VOC family protein [Clostridium akagii]|uniref:VOC family protein n=1 Tax=Clostridium akagii TaxID=91623 RepID=UPI00068BDEA1|nr:VOC family protein [Clostridium akagii]